MVPVGVENGFHHIDNFVSRLLLPGSKQTGRADGNGSNGIFGRCESHV
jgi:hypothetical protein